jgi:hypothetical protein
MENAGIVAALLAARKFIETPGCPQCLFEVRAGMAHE